MTAPISELIIVSEIGYREGFSPQLFEMAAIEAGRQCKVGIEVIYSPGVDLETALPQASSRARHILVLRDEGPVVVVHKYTDEQTLTAVRYDASLTERGVEERLWRAATVLGADKVPRMQILDIDEYLQHLFFQLGQDGILAERCHYRRTKPKKQYE